MRVYTSSQAKRKRCHCKVNSRCFFVDFRPPYWCPSEVHPHGVSIQSSIKLCETFRQITQKYCTTGICDLEKLFMYYSFITFHFLASFIMISNLFFNGVTVKTLFLTCQATRDLSCRHLSEFLL